MTNLLKKLLASGKQLGTLFSIVEARNAELGANLDKPAGDARTSGDLLIRIRCFFSIGG